MRTYKLLLLAFAFLLYNCGSGTGPPASNRGTPPTTSSPAATITLTATPSTITVSGTSSLSATVLDSLGANVADGTAVIFTLTSSNGTLSSSSDTTSSGVASVSFTGTSAGSETVAATSGSASGTATITIQSPAVGTIEFTSATPSAIGILGSGKTTTSSIIFTVKDEQGTVMPDGTAVSFTMSGPSGGRLPDDGGEYIGDRDATPTTFTSSITGGSGQVEVFLNSGNVAGPVFISASVTVAATTLTSSSTPLSIGGGTPNDAHLTIVTDTFNLEGLAYANIQANISVFLADRFGNFDILENTSVSFIAEAGAIATSSLTDSTGSTTVTYRTQNSAPQNVAPIGTSPCSGAPTSAADAFASFPTEWEICLQEYIGTTYYSGVDPTAHPRDGWATIMVHTSGEEDFDDANGNGSFDAGEFTAGTHDTIQEPILDINDNGTYDDGTGTDPLEEFIDSDGDGSHDAANGSWDADKEIYEDIQLLITGGLSFFELSPSTFAIANNSSQSFTLLVADQNLNPLIAGSTIAISADTGTLSGTTSYTYPNVFNRGPIEISFVLTDAAPTDTDPAEVSNITIDVTWKGIKSTIIRSGTVD